jgi:hypothetical protein
MELFANAFGSLAGVPAIVGLLLTSLTIYLTSDWRLSLTGLLLQYIFVGLALTRFIQSEVALVKILTGVLAVFVLYLTAHRIQEEQRQQADMLRSGRFLGLSLSWGSGPLGLPLRLLTVVLVALGIVRLFTAYHFPLVSPDVAFTALWMAGMGMLGLVLSSNPLRVAAALLTLLASFDLVFGALEPSRMLAGFWSALTLLSAFAFSYLAIVQSLAESSKLADGEEAQP